MLSAITGALGLASGVMSLFSGNSANNSAAASTAFQQQAFDTQMGYYEDARAYFGGSPMTASGQTLTTEQANGMSYIGSDGTDTPTPIEYGPSGALQASLDVAGMLGAPSMASAHAYTSEATEIDYSAFLASFQEAIGTNEQALTDFNRRYGPIMDNVADSIAAISADRIATQGREQLSLDAETVRNQFTEQMASAGIGRSGMSTEMEMRVQADIAQQARAIDVNSEQQASTLRNAGVQTLNSMENIQQGIFARGENLYQNQASGQLQGAITDANNLTQVDMQNATNQTNVSMANANSANQGALAAYSMRSSALLSGLNSQNSFYANTQMPGTSGVSSAMNAETSNFNADAAGYMTTAGNLFSSEPVQNMFSPTTTNTEVSNPDAVASWLGY